VPVFAVPVFAVPVFAVPVFAVPVFAASAFAVPVFAASAFAVPAFAASAFAVSAFARPVNASTTAGGFFFRAPLDTSARSPSYAWEPNGGLSRVWV
jgi:hypothetical protein